MVRTKKDPDLVSKTEKEAQPETYTLRLPSHLRKRVERLAESKKRSLNQQIIRILELYFMDAGDFDDSMKSSSGRLFEVKAEPYFTHGERALLLDVQIIDARNENRVAMLNFGVETEALRQLQIHKQDEESAVHELIRVILRFYFRHGIEPEAISWSQYANRGYTNTRIIHSQELEDVRTFEDLLSSINQDDWYDWPFVGNYLQELNRRIASAYSFSAAMELAAEVLESLGSAAQVRDSGPSWPELEKELLCAVINITANKHTRGKSQLRYMRSLVNSPKDLVFEAFGKENFEKLTKLSDADLGTQSMVFARVNQMLLQFVPQPVIPALSKQKSLGGFSF